MRVLDLFSGLGGFSAAFKHREHEVVTIDIDERFKPDIVADILDIRDSDLPTFDVVLASPPCLEFSRESMPWKRTGKMPSMELVNHTLRLIEGLNPSCWVLENVKGAVPYLGSPTKRVGSRYLWGDFPLFIGKPEYGKEKLAPSPNRAALRAKVPFSLSLALCQAIETWLPAS